MTSVRLSHWVRALKASPASSASSQVRYHPVSRADAARHLPLSYDDFGGLAVLSDVCAIVVASMVTGSAYRWLAYGRVGSVAEFLIVGAISAALTAPLIKLRGLCTSDSLLSVRSQVAPIIFIWICIVFFLLGVSFTLKINEGLSRGSILSFAITAPLIILGQRFLLKRTMLAIFRKGWFKRSKIVLVARDVTSIIARDEALRAYDVVETYLLPPEAEGIHLDESCWPHLGNDQTAVEYRQQSQTEVCQIHQKGWLKRFKIVLITRDLKRTTANDEALHAYDVVETYVLPPEAEEILFHASCWTQIGKTDAATVANPKEAGVGHRRRA